MADAASIRSIAARPLASPLTLAGLRASVDETRAAAASRTAGPPEPAGFASLRARLEKARAALPPTYRRAVADPLLRALDQLGPAGFSRLLATDPDREGTAGLLLDVAQAVLQRGERFQPRATAAFQEVVSDLYEGFLSAESRRGVKPPDHGVAAPLVLWGGAESGPYTWPATATAKLDVGAAVVNLPAANASAGLLAWPALAHETAGHDLLEADEGLRDELAKVVRDGLGAGGMPASVATYWSERIDETAADVMGVLNMGPAAAVGLVGYFRAINGMARGVVALRNVGSADDPHPADIVRGYVAAETVRLLSFKGAGQWADRLVAEVDRDLGQVRLGGLAVTASIAKEAAALVARAIVRTPLQSLERRALGEIQGWSDKDEEIASALRRELREGGAGSAAPGRNTDGAYAAHAVAAGVYEAVSGDAAPRPVLERMVGLLAGMHARNGGWKGNQPAAAQSMA